MSEKQNRQLAAIMFTDMVGFTALMQQDEKLGLKKRNRHKEVFELFHGKHNGKIIQYFGDGTLSIFPNSVDAVQCAIAIQKALKAPIEVPLRIGIHSGNIVVEEDGIIGDAVNIASRIESFANVGGVLISDSVHDQVKNQDWEFVPLGKFNLKNVERPFEIYAVSSEGLVVPNPNFLQGKGEKAASFKSNIPVPATPILGREKEIKELIELLKKHQVVTVTGTGGMGKTRISLELCQRLKSEFQDGIAYVSMATLTDATEVMPTLAAALDVVEAAGRNLTDGVAALIGERKALLVLDNLEQVISAAQEIAALASKCTNLKILCTSRTPLKIKAEQEYALHPLPLPPQIKMDSLLSYSAIELFVSRAQKVNMDFELTPVNAEAVVGICRRMDGLPLALELAAARIRILPPEKLLHRLSRALDVLTTGSKDLPERHQTLRATIDWSHSLLNEIEQQLFRRLAVFAGGFTLEAVESVCYDNEDDAFLAIDELESLVDKGLVENIDGGRRFGMLQTINDFALEQLKAAGEVDLFFQKHAAYFLTIAKQIHKGIQGEEQDARMKQGVVEEANFQVALDFLLKKAKSGDEDARELGLTICGEFFMYWHIRGKHSSAKFYITSLMDATPDLTPSLGKCKALFCFHLGTFCLAEYELCKEKSLLGYQLAEELGDAIEMGKSSFALAFAYFTFDIAKATAYSNEAVARFQATGDSWWLGCALWQNGVMHLSAGNIAMAKERFAASYALQRHDNEMIGGTLSGLAMVEVINGHLDAAIELYQKALHAFATVGDRPEVARVLSEMSWTYLALGHTRKAKKYTLDSIEVYQEVGSMRGVGISMNGLAAIEAVEGRPENAVKITAAAAQFARQEGVVVEYGINNQALVYLDKAKKELSDIAIEKAENTGKLLSVKEVLELVKEEMAFIS